jgi:hypothetical protein
MGSRFSYQSQGTLRKVALCLRYPHRWREKTAPWIFDNETGARLQLTCDEHALIRRLNVRLPGKKEWPLSPVSLDEVASAIVRRRLGYVFEWARISALETPPTAHPGRKRAASSGRAALFHGKLDPAY